MLLVKLHFHYQWDVPSCAAGKTQRSALMRPAGQRYSPLLARVGVSLMERERVSVGFYVGDLQQRQSS